MAQIESTQALVLRLQKELETLQPELRKRVIMVETNIAEIGDDKEKAEDVKLVIAVDEELIRKQAEQIKELSSKAKADLDAAMPALHDAMIQLESLDKADIAEIRVYTNPPEMIRVLMAALCCLLGESEDWSNARQVLLDMQFLKRLTDFDRDNVPSTILERLEEHIKNPELTIDNLARVSLACKSLCQWVLAMCSYLQVMRLVEPKQRMVAQLSEEMGETQAKLNDKQIELAAVENQLRKLAAQLEENVHSRNQLKAQIETTSIRQVRAKQLLMYLKSELNRWKQDLAVYDTKINNLIGDILMASASIVYFGLFPELYRDHLMKVWVAHCQKRSIPVSDNYSLVNSLGDSLQIMQWQIDGLPRDGASTENGIVMTYTKRYPLLIDPYGQAEKWLLQSVGKGEMIVCTGSESNILQQLEHAIRNGLQLLITEIHNINGALLESLLSIRSGLLEDPKFSLKLGDIKVECNRNFRMFIMTKQSPGKLLPHITTKMCIINFSVTKLGLEDQLLGEVVRHERPHLEQSWEQAIQTIASNRLKLRDIEDNVLGQLGGSTKNILDDDVIMQSIGDCHTTAVDTQSRAQAAEQAEAEINKTRREYLTVASRAASMFFILMELPTMNPMYCYSLSYFKQLFEASLKLSDDPMRPELAKLSQIEKLRSSVTYGIVNVISRGLFSEHKLLLSFMIACSIYRQNSIAVKPPELIAIEDELEISRSNIDVGGKKNDTLHPTTGLGLVTNSEGSFEVITDAEWQFFLRGVPSNQVRLGAGLMFGRNQAKGKPPEWLTQTQIDALDYMDLNFNFFAGISAGVYKESELWKTVVGMSNVYQAFNTLGKWGELTGFQRLMLIKVLSPNYLIQSIKDFTGSVLGSELIHFKPLELAQVFSESTNKTPMLFIQAIGSGSDPANELEQFASTMGRQNKLQIISLGSGQGPAASSLLTRAMRLGMWVFLQNCHLAMSWMPVLEKTVANLTGVVDSNTEKVHPSFRLWLSSEPVSYFPTSILQQSLKMVLEAPVGIKENTLRSLTSLPSSFFDAKLFASKEDEGEEDSLSLSDVSRLKARKLALNRENLNVWRAMVVRLCFFHAVVQERNRFGHSGWNSTYSFHLGDLQASLSFLELAMFDFYPIATHWSTKWMAISEFAGNVIYGGHVSDEWDRKCMGLLLDQFSSPNTQVGGSKTRRTLTDDFTYSQTAYLTPRFDIPDPGTLFTYRAYIDQIQTPALEKLLGMPQNAQKLLNLHEGNEFMTMVRQIQHDTASVSRIVQSAETVLGQATHILDVLPLNIDMKLASALRAGADNSSPDSILVKFFYREVDRFNQLLNAVRDSLEALINAINGASIMSPDDEALFQSIETNTVPAVWQRVAYPSCKNLGSWISDLELRVNFMNGWLKGGTPSTFWLSGLFYAKGFLTAVLQRKARQSGVAIDSLKFNFIVLDEGVLEKLNTQGDGGINVHGLFVASARWDPVRHTLTESSAESLYEKMPSIRLVPISTERIERAGDDVDDVLPPPRVYSCPLFRTSARSSETAANRVSENFLLSVELPCDRRSDYWILRGVVLLGEVD